MRWIKLRVPGEVVGGGSADDAAPDDGGVAFLGGRRCQWGMGSSGDGTGGRGHDRVERVKDLMGSMKGLGFVDTTSVDSTPEALLALFFSLFNTNLSMHVQQRSS